MKHLLALALAVVAASNALAADYVWIEGEKPTSKNYDAARPAGVEKAQFLSEEKWLSVNIPPEKVDKDCPKDGVLIGYDFEAPSAGKYEIWNRIGMEFVRSPFDWRIDQGEWKTITPQDLTTDLTEVGFWNEVAWYKMGDADLAAGKHSLQIRLLPQMKDDKGKKVLDKILYCSDALCISKGAFRPNGKFKPDADWQTADDRKAAAQVFEVKAPAAAAPGERWTVPLGGLWQVCRYDEQEVIDRAEPTKTLPDAQNAYWMSIKVPGNKFAVKPELAFCHRFVYRTKINVPADMAGRSFFLRLPSIDMIGSVIVNGRFCGGTLAVDALWECDVTKAVKPGQVNEVCVVIKDPYYAISEKKAGHSCRMHFNTPASFMEKNWLGQLFDFPVASGLASQAGILEEPSLVVAGPAYTTDVFAMPSVKKKELGLEVTVFNPGAGDKKVEVVNEIVPVGDVARLAVTAHEKVFAAKELTVPAGQAAVLKIAEPWAKPRLWWPDEPNLYDVLTAVRLDGKVADVRRTRFGFREWEWDGPQFRLNGVPWQLWADCTAGDGGKDPDAAIATWRKNGNNMWRFWGNHFGGLDRHRALDLMDRSGMIVRRTGIFDGQGANYLGGLTNNPALYANWLEQQKAQFRSERNHPSILIWSIENEITFINSRNLGQIKAVEPEIAKVAKELMALDPTRPVMVDGGNCLADESLPVNGGHYLESAWRDYPDEAYTLERALEAHVKGGPTWGKSPWRLVPDRPIFMGESYFVRGSAPGEYSQFAGEGCFQGWGEYTRLGAGVYAKMLAEGYRWWGVAAFHFWAGDGDMDLEYNSFKPVCVFCREWNWTFAGGSEVPRTLKVFNDTRYADPIEMAWELKVDGRKAGGEKKTFGLDAGKHEQVTITLTLPRVSKRTAGEFVLTCSRGGKEVFREVKHVVVIDAAGGAKPSLKKGDLAVIDPFGSVKARLQARKIDFTEVAKVDEIPASAKVIVVGKDAVSPRDSTDPRWMALAARGARLLVLDQANPLHYLATPADFVTTDFVGRIAFMENASHPVFEGLDQPDFFTWSGDHVVYRNVYRKATRGAVSLAHCDERLSCSAVAECPVNDGLLVLCQMVVGEKLATDPAAQRLFDNLLAYAAKYALVQKSTAVVMDGKGPAAKLLTDSGLKFDPASDVLAAMADGKHPIVVFDATPANLKALAGAPDKVKAFTGKGGWLMAWGLTADGLADFSTLVGVEHVLRPFELERVTLPAMRDPILAGLTIRDVTMESNEQIFPWAGDKFLVDDEFTQVLDLDDIAPFAEIPGAKAGDSAAGKKARADWPRNAVNGFTSADGWVLIHYLPYDKPVMKFTLPREETIDGFSVVLNTHYAIAGKVNLTFDDDLKPVALKTKQNGERQDFTLEPRKARRITVELADLSKVDKVTGIDNLWIHVKRPSDWPKRVRPLLNIGALVKYPMGDGGVILNQVNAKPSEAVPVNAQKKQAIVATLLRNLHATFSGGKVLTTGNLKFRPVPLDDQCNQFLAKDRGWFDGGRDLAHMPFGTNAFAGVTYAIRDFRTSPVPACIMLAGPGAKGTLPKEVKGLKVEGKAGVLFFLHTFNRTAEWRRQKPEDAPPVVFRYVVRYADGQTAEVPVLYGEGVDHWLAREPRGLKSASIAWAAPFPNDKSEEQAVVYQFQWTNPRPNVPIQGVDMLYGPQGSQYGTPALLAITAATEAK
jgi:beta-galactosidase